MKKIVKIVSIVAILLVIGYMIFAPIAKEYFSKDETSGDVPSGNRRRILNVNALVIGYESLQEKIITTGSALPDETVDLSFETSGKITDIFMKEGTFVKKGELLACINDAPLQAQLLKLKAQIPLAESRLFRQKTLLEKDAVSQETYEQVFTELEKLKADIDLVEAQIAQSKLRAPFDGFIGLRQESAGSYVSPTTVIARMTKISPLKIEFSVPERYAMQISNGTPLSFYIAGNIIPYEAKVYAMDAEINVNTRTRTARALYNNEKGEIAPGSYTSIEIDINNIDRTIAIPSDAIVPEMGVDKVFVYNNGKAKSRVIKAGLRTEAKVQVLEGIEIGDTLITNGVLQLREDLPVQLDYIEN